MNWEFLRILCIIMIVCAWLAFVYLVVNQYQNLRKPTFAKWIEGLLVITFNTIMCILSLMHFIKGWK